MELSRRFTWCRCPHCNCWLVAAYQDKSWWCTECGCQIEKIILKQGLEKLREHKKKVASEMNKVPLSRIPKQVICSICGELKEWITYNPNQCRDCLKEKHKAMSHKIKPEK